MSKKVTVILKGYPRLSETFIAQELLALEQRGLELSLVSLRHPTDKSIHPIHREIKAPVRYLPEYVYQEPLRVLKSWWKARKLPGYETARATFFRDLKRDISPNRVRRFAQACVLAAELPDQVDWLYAHFLHTPSSVTRYTAFMRQLPWCGSAHAKDIWTSPEWELREKLSDIKWLATCTNVNADYLRSLSPDNDRVDLVYHGLDFTRFNTKDHQSQLRDGTRSDQPVMLVSVGRAVAKKGYDDLLTALSLLPEELNWRFIHIGGGNLSKDLKSLAQKLGIAENINWMGAQPQEVVLEQYRQADLFVLASRITEDGDRDGMPNVLMEAQSQSLACLSTRVSAIPELIIDQETGLLVPPQAPKELSQALQHLISNPQLRQQLGKAGEKRVREKFSMKRGIDQLMTRFMAG
ncbi:glycosyltransferase family 4 protein [Kiloniella laminariae]|uniref:Glycosyltransferase family 4 protein n=1 Tax=Kiloniella laminariae TaxID=454162 RepID=A0ABT4LLB3_9PROT|nr:glycosyltransferase family 4 protein [Kiloniella laminariae]MCZ4281146.1 glycosyltransferase family 4 protein [Kiloniella laminariae]